MRAREAREFPGIPHTASDAKGVQWCRLVRSSHDSFSQPEASADRHGPFSYYTGDSMATPCVLSLIIISSC